MQTVNTQFQALESKITNVGRTAVRIGQSSRARRQFNADLTPFCTGTCRRATREHRPPPSARLRSPRPHPVLQRVRPRRHFEASPSLAPYRAHRGVAVPAELTDPPVVLHRLEAMRKEGGREGRAKVAVAARRLMSLAKEVEGVESAEAVGQTSLPNSEPRSVAQRND